jgi:hypothetical protein
VVRIFVVRVVERTRDAAAVVGHPLHRPGGTASFTSHVAEE